MTFSVKDKALVAIIAAFSASCSGSNGSLSGEASGDRTKKDEAGGQRSANGTYGSDAEDEEADHPSEVSGAFLTCAFMDTEREVLNKARTDADTGIAVACGLYRGTKLLPLTNLKALWRIQRNDGVLISPQVQGLNGGAFSALVTVPVRNMNGTIQLDVRDKWNKKAAFKRAIWSITSFNVRRGFDIREDLFNQQSLIVHQQTEGSEAKTPWWMRFVAVLVRVIGEDAKKTASDEPAGVFFPCRNCVRGNSNELPSDSSGYIPWRRVPATNSWTPATNDDQGQNWDPGRTNTGPTYPRGNRPNRQGNDDQWQPRSNNSEPSGGTAAGNGSSPGAGNTPIGGDRPNGTGSMHPPSSPPATSPPATSPPATSPPATSPPATSPPATSPPSPPATTPPSSDNSNGSGAGASSGST